jgi:hypothetical protein
MAQTADPQGFRLVLADRSRRGNFWFFRGGTPPKPSRSELVATATSETGLDGDANLAVTIGTGTIGVV